MRKDSLFLASLVYGASLINVELMDAILIVLGIVVLHVVLKLLVDHVNDAEDTRAPVALLLVRPEGARH